jgi:hypothetical protein
MAAIGAAGLARALGMLDGSDRDRRTRVHAVELVLRASCAPPLLLPSPGSGRAGVGGTN